MEAIGSDDSTPPTWARHQGHLDYEGSQGFTVNLQLWSDQNIYHYMNLIDHRSSLTDPSTLSFASNAQREVQYFYWPIDPRIFHPEDADPILEPPTTACSNRSCLSPIIPVADAFTSTRDGRILCEPCFREREEKHLAREERQ